MIIHIRVKKKLINNLKTLAGNNIISLLHVITTWGLK